MFLLLLIGAVILLWRSNQSLKQDNIRLANNMKTLNASVKYIQTQNGKLAAQTDVLLVRTGELKELFPVQAKTGRPSALFRDPGPGHVRVYRLNPGAVGNGYRNRHFAFIFAVHRRDLLVG